MSSSSSTVVGEHREEASTTRPPRFNAEQRQWLRDYYGNEINFYRCLGLNMDNDGHRSDATGIVQLMTDLSLSDGSRHSPQPPEIDLNEDLPSDESSVNYDHHGEEADYHEHQQRLERARRNNPWLSLGNQQRGVATIPISEQNVQNHTTSGLPQHRRLESRSDEYLRGYNDGLAAAGQQQLRTVYVPIYMPMSAYGSRSNNNGDGGDPTREADQSDSAEDSEYGRISYDDSGNPILV